MKQFQQIKIQSKDDKIDFRSFCYCIDEQGNKWTLRGYGSTAGRAADQVFNRYLESTENWDVYGYIIDPTNT